MNTPQIRSVNQYHRDMKGKGLNMAIMAFREDDGLMIQRGWVVSGYSGADSHRLFKTKKQAKAFVAEIMS